MQSMQPLIDGRTEAEWCREACRIGAYDCVGPDGKHIRTFTGERTAEKVLATIQGLKAQAERYDRTAGVTEVVPDDRCPACYGSEVDGFKRGLRCSTCGGTGTRGVEGRLPTKQEDAVLLEAAKRSSTLVAPGKLADGVALPDGAKR
jgi:PHP family Zn ribbon phosphoesterase